MVIRYTLEYTTSDACDGSGETYYILALRPYRGHFYPRGNRFFDLNGKAQSGKTMISPSYLDPLFLPECELYSQYARECLSRANETLGPNGAYNIVEGV